MCVDRGVTVQADLTGGTIEAVRLTENGKFRKLLLTIRKNEAVAQIRLSPAEVTDFAMDLNEVIEWLGERESSR